MNSKKSIAVAEQPAAVAHKEPNVDKPALELTARERTTREAIEERRALRDLIRSARQLALKIT